MSNNSRVLYGVGSIINHQNTRPNMNVDEIARKLIDDGIIGVTATVSEEDPTDKFNAELNLISRKLGIELSDKKCEGSAPTSTPVLATAFRPRTPNLSYNATEAEPEMGPEDNANSSSRSSDSSDSDIGAPPAIRNNNAITNYSSRPNPPQSSRSGNFKEYTCEQIRRRHIENVISEYPNKTSEDYSFVHVKEEQKKTTLLGEIDALLDDLHEEGVDLSRIPKVNMDSSMVDINNVLESLKYKAGRARGSDMAEYLIMLLAKGAEYLCNGKRDIAGFKPDLTGWSHTIAPKVRRLRNPAGEIVHKAIEESGLGPVGQIMLEIVPSAILYSTTQNSQIKDEGVFRDADMR
jgi:hypothetical protein